MIKVEQPGRGDDTRGWGPPFEKGESSYFMSVNRNKESLTLNLKHPEGRRILEALLDEADILVENFRPGTLARMQLGYTDVAPKCPRLVYCSISGFGHTGPRRTEPGYDAVLQAEGGLMSITGERDGPAYRLGVAIADITSGMFAAYGVAVALLARHRTGQGQFVDVGMLDSVAALLSYQAGIYFATDQAPTRLGNRHPTIVPYETLEARDGELVVAVGNDQLWRSFATFWARMTWPTTHGLPRTRTAWRDVKRCGRFSLNVFVHVRPPTGSRCLLRPESLAGRCVTSRRCFRIRRSSSGPWWSRSTTLWRAPFARWVFR